MEKNIIEKNPQLFKDLKHLRTFQGSWEPCLSRNA
jgi:hypothetical protein